MIDDLIMILDVGADLGLIAYDETVVRAPHRDAEAFDVDALAADAARLRATARLLDDATVSTDVSFGDLWSGSGGGAAGIALASATTNVDAVVAEIAETAATLDAATSTVTDVMGRYRHAMATVCEPTICGIDIGALRISVAAGSVARDDVRGELIARIEYADTVGRTVTEALADTVRAVSADTGAADDGPGHPSAGELVLAGRR
ncbi:hypothetical protein L5G28_16005 [Gordonia sp. HY285]|uniref:hypothetical protein n=1 Tax=Gordonia liuliyuniae TaxID=2911517 RepID=UPI001F477B28|nr:hypothetical protein [Gordonia liuliyuniae]MCF8611650.1 hypothetical protein [Gordonia liuliyuniae]